MPRLTLLAGLALIIAAGLGCQEREFTPQVGDVGDSPLADLGVDLTLDISSTDFSKEAGDAAVVDVFGLPCESDDDCLGRGVCMESQEGRTCTLFCFEESCPEQHSCKHKEEDSIGVCVPWYSRLCMPCLSNDDCVPEGIGTFDVGARCVDFTGEGSFCAGRCGANGSCPNGYECSDVKVGDRAVMKLCLPESGECQCSPLAISLGASTECSIKNEYGECVGERVCVEEGLTPCLAQEPQPEICDGEDNDCDGMTDEDLGSTVCGLGVCEHSVPNCMDGREVECDPMEGALDELCNGLDDDCDGETDEGLGTTTCGLGVCEHEVANCLDGKVQECDPMEAAADETCNGLDDDCDGETDEELGTTTCGLGVCENTVPNCLDGEVVECLPLDAASEETCDGLDNDCDGLTDQGFDDTDEDGSADCVDPDDDGDEVEDNADNCPLTPNPDQKDFDEDGFGDVCDFGCWLGEADGWESDCDQVPDLQDNCPADHNPDQADTDLDGEGDICDEDDDGDGIPDASDNCVLVSNELQGDLDQDGVGDACDDDDDGDGVPDLKDNCPWVSNADQTDTDVDELGDLCDDDDDGDGDPDEADCAPMDPAIFHLQVESCNGIDDNCSGEVDEEGANGCSTYFADADGDGAGAEGDFKCLCEPVEPYTTQVGGDCAPDDPEVFPAAEEGCNGKDDNCNSETDEGYPDSDADGYADCVDSDDDGDGIADDQDNCALISNEDQTDTDSDEVGDACDTDDDGDGALDEDDCDPLDPEAAPGLAEVCDGKDNDCDGETDEDLGTDTCGLGECHHTVDKCKDGQPQVCDPFEGASEEVCDGKDNDCDGETDEDLGTDTCGLGECHHTVDKCKDGQPQVCDPFEGASEEVCDGKDNDCDGETDEGFEDFDKDGLPDCVDPDDDNDLSPDEADCDDHNPAAYPGGAEICDAADNDCNGWTDEGCPGAVTGKDCKSIHKNFPEFPSGTYTIDPDGPGGADPLEVFCDMKSEGGGWTRIADVDVSKTGCPKGWVLTNFPKVCFRNMFVAGCKSVYFQTHGIVYSDVRGYVRAYQCCSPDAFDSSTPKDINGPYLDGVSITHGAPRHHIWSYAGGLSEDGYYPGGNCPCAPNAGSGPPSFVGENYYCESGNSGPWEHTWYSSDPLFDGHGCPPGNSCCASPELPWFTTALGGSFQDPLEVRLCGDQPSYDEDVGIYKMELYIR